jgi:chaperonin GroES
MNFRPLYDRVLVQRATSETRSAGGLFIPESAKEKPQEANVVKVGPGRTLEDGTVRAMTVKEGDRVLLSRYPTNEVKIEGQDYVIIREDEILAVVE